MKQVNVAEIKDHFSEYLNEAAQGRDIGICRRNVLIARLTASHEKQSSSNKTRLGCGNGTVTFMADLTEPMMSTSDWNMLDNESRNEPHP